MKGRLITILLLTLGILTGCKSVRFVSPSLPDYQMSMPTRPMLDKSDPEGNVVSLTAYAGKLEVIIDGWVSFYERLREIYGNEHTT